MLITGYSKEIYNSRIPVDVTHLIGSFDLYCSMIEYRASQICREHKYLKTFSHITAPVYKGVEFLLEQYDKNGYMEYIDDRNQKRLIASFLYHQHGVLERDSVAAYFTENEEVLVEYAALFDFRGKTVDVALREFVTRFRLPGEAQTIDKFMMIFAKGYMHDHGDTDLIEDDVYILAYSILMLNTSLHNPRARSQTNKQGFLTQILGEDILKSNTAIEMASGIYDRISANPIPK